MTKSILEKLPYLSGRVPFFGDPYISAPICVATIF